MHPEDDEKYLAHVSDQIGGLAERFPSIDKPHMVTRWQLQTRLMELDLMVEQARQSHAIAEQLRRIADVLEQGPDPERERIADTLAKIQLSGLYMKGDH